MSKEEVPIYGMGSANNEERILKSYELACTGEVVAYEGLTYYGENAVVFAQKKKLDEVIEEAKRQARSEMAEEVKKLEWDNDWGIPVRVSEALKERVDSILTRLNGDTK